MGERGGVTPSLHEQVERIVAAVAEPLALDRWSLRIESGQMEDCRACCQASPEYREATIRFDFDKLETGDDLTETVIHELAHCHGWPLHAVAEKLADSLADTLPRGQRDAVRATLQEYVREAAERVDTDVGQTYLRLLRRAGILTSA